MIPDSLRHVKATQDTDIIGSMRVAVLGAGSWGTALSLLLARNGADVALVGRNPEDVETMRSARENFRYLPGFALPENVSYHVESDELGIVDLWTVAVPSAGVRQVSARISGSRPIVMLASKGLEPSSAALLSEVITSNVSGARLCVLGGPNLAVELVRGVPSVAVVAGEDADAVELARKALSSRTFRLYRSGDPIGVQLAGALKNVMAIGAGMSDGLGFGDNTKGALLARGLREMALIGQACGALPETFYGVAGVGDLLATGVSRLSRNYRVGYALGQGQSLSAALSGVEQVAEGVPTSDGAMSLASRHGLEAPIHEMVHHVIHGRLEPRLAVDRLMERPPKEEEVLGAGGATV